MKFTKLLSLMFVAYAATATAETVTGLDNDGGPIGQYDIGGQTYWWLCIEPGPPALLGTTTAQIYSFQNGWDKQNTERYDLYQNDLTNFSGDLYNIALPRQIAVMDYVLDTYLPWADAGVEGRFLNQNGSFTNFDNDDTFHNSMFAVQNFLSEMYGKQSRDSFTTPNLSDFASYYVGEPNGRAGIFQDILNDVGMKDQAFFDAYTVQHDYATLNTFYAEHDPMNWQDGLIIGFAAVPEPGSALLIACCGIAWTIRRRRRI